MDFLERRARPLAVGAFFLEKGVACAQSHKGPRPAARGSQKSGLDCRPDPSDRVVQHDRCFPQSEQRTRSEHAFPDVTVGARCDKRRARFNGMAPRDTWLLAKHALLYHVRILAPSGALIDRVVHGVFDRDTGQPIPGKFDFVFRNSIGRLRWQTVKGDTKADAQAERGENPGASAPR